MKRVIAAVVGTVAGVVALLSFKSTTPQSSAGPLPSAALPAASGASPTAAATQAPASVGSTAKATAGPATPTAGPAKSTAAKATAAQSTRKFLGQAVTTQYGIVQVEVTVNGSKITNVQFVQLQAFDGRSQQINSYAAPQLLQETLTAQSAQIDSVSGASYTSQGYVQSLQSALDAAGIK